MSKELDDELAIGTALAEALIAHVARMGACAGEIPVVIDGRKWVVSVKEKSPKDDTGVEDDQP